MLFFKGSYLNIGKTKIFVYRMISENTYIFQANLMFSSGYEYI